MKSALMLFAFLASTLILCCGAVAPTCAAVYMIDQARGDDAAAGAEAAPWKTIARGVKDLKAGDTLLVGPGVYRETAAVMAHGTAEARVTIKAVPGAGAVMSGSERIAGWKQCSRDDADGNEHFKSIFYADIDWTPTDLFEDGKQQTLARTPNEGWWPCTKADANSVTDPVHLTQEADAWNGATLFFFRYKGVAQMKKPVKSFDPAAHTITLAEPLSTNPKVTYTPGSDRYRLLNKVGMIDRPGEWAWTATGDGNARVFYWPHGKNIAESLIEIPRRARILILGSAAYCTVEGLELRHAIKPGRTADCAIGGDANKNVPGSGVGITVRGCTIHHNGRFGFQVRSYKDLQIAGNLIYRNEYGVAIGGCSGAVIEANEIAENLVDGLIISHGSRDIVVRKNYIHHHNLYGHPDNMQMYRDVRNITVDSNLLLSGGQSVMMEQTDTLTFTNNVIAGSAANMMICGGGAADNYTWTRNTFALWASSLFNLTGKNYTLSKNIMVNNGGAVFYGFPNKGTFASDNNLLWRVPGVTGRLGGKKGDDGKTAWFNTLEDIRSKAGQEMGSVYEDPQFKNAPVVCTTLNNRRIGDCTRQKLFLSRNAELFVPGDFVEVHFDGVKRKVAGAEQVAIRIEPPLETIPDRVMFVINWKDRQDFTLDFSSPLNDKYGSTINVPAFTKGDFDSDGKRDVPAYR